MRLINTGDDLQLIASNAITEDDGVHWQVVEYAGAQVQRNNFPMTTLPIDQGITAVNLNKTFVTSTYSSASNVWPNTGGLETDLDADNNVHFERNADAGTTLNVSFEVVEFTGGEQVQSGTLNFADTVIKQEITIDPIDLSKTIAFLSHHQKGGQGAGTGTTGTEDDNPGMVWFYANLTSSTTLNVTRANSTGIADVTWHVIQFSNQTQSETTFTDVTTTDGWTFS
jgi:hypothetical protein